MEERTNTTEVSKSELIRRCKALLMLNIGLATGNFIFQAMAQENWTIALERTYFQTVALLMVLTLP